MANNSEIVIIIEKTAKGRGLWRAKWLDACGVVVCRSLLRESAQEAFSEVSEIMAQRAGDS